MSLTYTEINKVSHARPIEEVLKLTSIFHILYGNTGHIPFHLNDKDTLIRCYFCLNDRTKPGRCSSFRSTKSLTKHVLKVHKRQKDGQVRYVDFFLVLEQVATALENDIPISIIPKVVEWNLEVR